MEFTRQYIQTTLEGINLYGFALAALFLLGAAWTAYNEIRKGTERQQVLRSFGITAVVVIALAIGWFLAGPEGTQEVQIRYYGIIIVAAMLLATAVAANLAKRTGRDPEHIYGALTWAIIPGIIGARLWFVLFPSESQVSAGFDTAYYLENFFDLNNGAIAIWAGGLSIFGAVLGGLLGTLVYLRRNKLPYSPWLDIAAVVLPLGQAIGRWANFVNEELFGTPTDLPWGISISRDILEQTAVRGGDPGETYAAIEYFNTKFHPLFLYESLWSLAAFVVLMYLFTRLRDRFRPLDFFLLYIMQYSFIRFLLEFIRVEITTVNGVNVSQVVTGIALALAVAYFFMRRSRGGAPDHYPAPEPQEMPKSGSKMVEEPA